MTGLSEPRPPFDRRLPTGLVDLFVLLLPIGLLSALGPWWGLHEVNTDEGIELMKAALLAEGYPLYDPTWSDHPPVVTWMLAAVHALSDGSVAAARWLMIGVASALVWGLFRIVRRTDGTIAGLVAVGCLIAGAKFQVLSVSVMIGLPAVAFAVLAVERAMSADGRVWSYLLAGALFALAVGSKFFGILLAPVLIAVVWAEARREGTDPTRALKRIGWGVLGFAVVLAGIAATIGDSLIPQLIEPHFQHKLADAFPYDKGQDKLWGFLLREPHALVLAGIGLVMGLVRTPGRLFDRLPALLWIGITTAALYRHVPLWSHQVVLLSVGLAWTAGWAGGALSARIGKLRAEGPRPVAVLSVLIVGIGLIAAAASAVSPAQKTADLFRTPAAEADLAAVSRLTERSEPGQWVLTDRPMDAYRAGLLVPPPVAVYSEKRLKGGLLPPEQLVEVLETYRPPVASFRRFFMGKPARAYLKAHYTRVPKTPGQVLFVR